jgi:lysozyme
LTRYKARISKGKYERFWTIGWGHRIKLNEDYVTITRAKADELFLEDSKWVENAINKSVKVDIGQNMFDALFSLVYNIGEGAFKKSNLLKLLNDRQFDKLREYFMKYVHDENGNVLSGLVKRRMEEWQLFTKEI